MPLTIIHLPAVARALARPFHVRPLAALGSLAVSVYLCQGEMDWHKHVDEDELFCVHAGAIGLETDRGALSLQAGELAVVPKGVLHRSHSELRSEVVLIRPAVLTERTNGHRHFYSTGAEPPLPKRRWPPEMPPAPFTLVALAQVEAFVLQGLVGQGLGPEWSAPAPGALWWVLAGELRLEVGPEVAMLGPGDLAVAPPDTLCRLVCRVPTAALTLAAAN